MKMNIKQIKEYLYNVLIGNYKTKEAGLNKKIEVFINKESRDKREEIIKKFEEMDIGERAAWELYPLDELKKIYSRFNFKS